MSVYRRKGSKIYTANFTIKGQRYFFSTGKTTKREALTVEHQERQKILKASKLTAQEKGAKMLLLDAIEIANDAKFRQSKDGQRSYRRAINVAAIVGNIPLGKINETTIAHLSKTLENRGCSKATLNRYKAVLAVVLKQLKQPSDCIQYAKEGNGRLVTVSKEDELKILKLLRQDFGGRRTYFAEVADLMEVLVDTGMRLGEALALRYQDVDYRSNLISIWINKGDRPRSIPMTERVRNILQERQAQNLDKPFAVKAHNVTTAWSFIRKEMGEGFDAVPHSLRHSFASRLISSGVSIFVVKELLGHADISQTTKYCHLNPSNLAEAITVLNV